MSQLSFRIDEDLKAEAKATAALQKRSLQDWLTDLVRANVGNPHGKQPQRKSKPD